MSRKKKANKAAKTKKPEEFRNRALGDLAKLKQAPPEKKAPAPKPAPVPLKEADEREALSEEELFLRAMEGASKAEYNQPPHNRPVPELIRVDEEAAAQLELVQLVDGQLPFDITYTDEFVEGVVQGLSRQALKKLRAGEYAIQDQVDLHGLTKQEARETVERFIIQSRVAGLRCVLIVHGRGLHSKDNVPVLKDSLRAWFERGRGPIGGSVLAFCSARPIDGGLGAMYVLLRKPERRQP